MSSEQDTKFPFMIFAFAKAQSVEVMCSYADKDLWEHNQHILMEV